MQSDVTQLAVQDQLLTWFEKNKRQVLWGAVAVAVIGFAAGIYVWKQNEVQASASEALSKLTSGNSMGGAQSANAEALLKWMEEAAGGVTESVRKKEGMLDDHEHGHEHDLA